MNYASTLAAAMAGPLGRQQAHDGMVELLDGRWSPAQAGAFLAALSLRGEGADELAGFADALRARAVGLPGAPAGAVDTCGTGGSGLPTTNTSTAAAFVLAAAGVPVAKHGNRASSGRCGSADVLEELGATIDLPAAQAAGLLGSLGVALLFAPRFHPALRALAPLRRELGIRTAFNLLGPLCNPARVRRQVIGVSDPRRAEAMAGALSLLGAERALLVAGEGGLDELSLCGPSEVWELTGGEVRRHRVEPAMVGLKAVPFEAIAGGDRGANASLVRGILRGEDRGPRADHVAFNAGAGLLVAGRAATLAEGVGQALEVLRGGAAGALLERYIEASRRPEAA